MGSFQLREIPARDIRFTSSSQVVADETAQLTMKMKPVTPLKAKGKVAIRVPGWFILDKYSEPPIYSSESVLENDSQATIVSPAEGFRVTSQNFDQSSRTFSFTYEGDKDIEGVFEVNITQFKNPVNQDKLSGFGCATLD